MTIDYQALREAAERAIPAMERLFMLPVDDDLISEQELKDSGVDIDALNAFKFLTGPETVLALLDELERNQQYIKSRDQENEDIALTVGKLRVELEATENNLIDSECHVAELEEALRDKQALLEASEKRIAELEAREVVLPRAHDVHPLGPQSAKIFCEFHRSIVNRCSDEIRKVGVKVSIKGN
ncbi:ead/Ea22-like family protein [Escherichia fergusonii]|nr:ead/Ea22-like family protein [Escherichia fergusonii]QMJ70459.1 ead/Ea22-like family protein [Escherichia fergusonii]QMJ74920.1 ead/Ea22-like family protein [Escherichia fergusonii]